MSATKAAQADHARREMSIRTAARCAYGAGIGGIVVSLLFRLSGPRRYAFTGYREAGMGLSPWCSMCDCGSTGSPGWPWPPLVVLVGGL